MTVVEVIEAIYYHARSVYVRPERCTFIVHPSTAYDLRKAQPIANIMTYDASTFQPFVFGVPVIADQTVPEHVIRLEMDGTLVVAGRYS